MIIEMIACKAWIAGNSGTIDKIRNAAGEHFGFIGAVHELIRGSLDSFDDELMRWQDNLPNN